MPRGGPIDTRLDFITAQRGEVVLPDRTRAPSEMIININTVMVIYKIGSTNSMKTQLHGLSIYESMETMMMNNIDIIRTCTVSAITNLT